MSMEYEERRVLAKREKEKNLDKIRGCLFGGAVGDALGYPVEFLNENMIFRKFGSGGIRSYELDKRTGKALISDDTQMTLFTANGILIRSTILHMQGIAEPPSVYVAAAYQDWLKTQRLSWEKRKDLPEYNGQGCSWLLDVPELYSRRVPGNTCLSGLEKRRTGTQAKDYIKHPLNHSHGCGGIMRIAPVALYDHLPVIEKTDKEAAQIAAITHGHPLGYMPAMVLNHVISRILFPEKERKSLKEIIWEAADAAADIFTGNEYLDEMTRIIELAVRLSENENKDLENIHQIGEGWTGEETLGIALYCSLRYQDDFSKGVIAAVNHRGDSDSTGAVTGNILGTLLGYEAIEEKWKQNLELSDVILEMAEDLCCGCLMDEHDSYRDPAWECKYMKMHRYQEGEKVRDR